MAIKSTIFKVTLSVADIDHAYYADHSLTLARHPSETDERMMMRLLALSFNAHLLNDLCQGDGTLVFGAGLSDPDEPDVWLKDFTGQTRLWVEVGQPEEKPLSRACSKSDKVVVFRTNSRAWTSYRYTGCPQTSLKSWLVGLSAACKYKPPSKMVI